MTREDTIAAIATPSGFGGVGIIRISGKMAMDICQQITRKKPQPRVATYTHFFDKNNQSLDQGIVLYFPTPNSFTGEDVVELQGHGGVIVINMMLNRVLECGAVLAQPGEFSLRAYLNDKIDLTQAESIEQIICATSESAVRCANRGVQGELRDVVQSLQQYILGYITQVESCIDFTDEDITPEDCKEGIQKTIEHIDELLIKCRQGAHLLTDIKITIAGPPNAGKSSLLNVLAQQDIAIISSQPGTTRDAIETTLSLAGINIQIADTAGIRKTKDDIEQQGIEKSWQHIEQADCVLWINDGSQNTKPTTINHPQVIQIFNKSDLIPKDKQTSGLWISTKTKQGIDVLIDKITQLHLPQEHSSPIAAKQRHILNITKAREHLKTSLVYYDNLLELTSENLRIAAEYLNQTSRPHSRDSVLSDIFSKFCIGK